MLIQQETSENAGSFYIDEAGERIAEITYNVRPDNTLNINHTEVDEKLQGKNIGFELVEKVVEYAREKQMKVYPSCSFAAKVFVKHPSFNDVLKK